MILNLKNKYILLLAVIFLNFHNNIYAQDTIYRTISINELFQLTEQNNQSLKVAAAGVEIAKQGVGIAKLQKLPFLSTSISGGYLGNATIIEKDFSGSSTAVMPHFANSFSIEASQLIFQGNRVNNLIKVASLQEQLGILSLEKNTQDMKLLLAGYYFDLYKLYNQRKVYEQNINLAEARLVNIQKMYEQGMVTRNDMIRTELQLSNFRLAISVVHNNIEILNKELTTATGLPSSVMILPDTNLLDMQPVVEDLQYYEQTALINDPDNLLAAQNVKIAEKYLDIAKAEKLPALSAFGGNTLQRPITSSSPALDMYANGWQAGLSLSFNISSLYNAPRKVKLEKSRIEQQKEMELLQQQNTNVAVHSAYIKHKEAISQSNTLEQDKQLAEENYRIIEKKYLNQLALMIDMLDATNAKLEAELQFTNAEINIIYTYYALLKTTGNI